MARVVCDNPENSSRGADATLPKLVAFLLLFPAKENADDAQQNQNRGYPPRVFAGFKMIF
jgi:hypothetical protein